jgi:hypothetical protein
MEGDAARIAKPVSIRRVARKPTAIQARPSLRTALATIHPSSPWAVAAALRALIVVANALHRSKELIQWIESTGGKQAGRAIGLHARAMRDQMVQRARQSLVRPDRATPATVVDCREWGEW